MITNRTETKSDITSYKTISKKIVLFCNNLVNLFLCFSNFCLHTSLTNTRKLWKINVLAVGLIDSRMVKAKESIP